MRLSFEFKEGSRLQIAMVVINTSSSQSCLLWPRTLKLSVITCQCPTRAPCIVTRHLFKLLRPLDSIFINVTQHDPQNEHTQISIKTIQVLSLLKLPNCFEMTSKLTLMSDKTLRKDRKRQMTGNQKCLFFPLQFDLRHDWIKTVSPESYKCVKAAQNIFSPNFKSCSSGGNVCRFLFSLWDCESV